MSAEGFNLKGECQLLLNERRSQSLAKRCFRGHPTYCDNGGRTLKQLIHCIYASLAMPQLKESELPLLLEQARSANAKANLTGMLLYIDGSFFQVLEGEAQTVEAVYTKIQHDPRHTRVTQIINEPIAGRDFSEWTMGFSVLDRLDAGKLIGENDFFTAASCVAQMGVGRAKKLLSAFRDGRWRLERTGLHRVVG
jgi:hypothetical protein